LLVDTSHQPLLDGFLDSPPAAAAHAALQTITYTRRRCKRREEDCVSDEGLRFDASVPVKVMQLSAPPMQSPDADAYEVIAHNRTRRLAQRPATCVVLEYVRPVLKRKSTGTFLTVPALSAPWEGTMADVSVVAGLIEDKCVDYLPLYRQHQRMQRSGVTVSQAALTTWVHRAAELLRPILDVQLRHILRSKILAMDETPIGAGREPPKGKMDRAWLWPIYGEADEIAFTYCRNHGRAQVLKTLGDFSGTLFWDGWSAYEHYAGVNQAVTHAQCWRHDLRCFEGALKDDADAASEALALIGQPYVSKRTSGHTR
jgi:transposase